ncbi:MAG: hypothetical protein ACXAC5_01635 [Promethearchaeota archaeon]
MDSRLRPLKRIVDWRAKNGRVIEVLECGHEQAQLKDARGPTNAFRRRCRACGWLNRKRLQK